MQKSLLQFFKPENYFEVRKALEHVGRQDLIGYGYDSLISDQPPREALNKKRRDANQAFAEQKSGDHIRGLRKTRKKPGSRVSRSQKTVGYRPKRSGND
jgi:hypothetical protein